MTKFGNGHGIVQFRGRECVSSGCQQQAKFVVCARRPGLQRWRASWFDMNFDSFYSLFYLLLGALLFDYLLLLTWLVTGMFGVITHRVERETQFLVLSIYRLIAKLPMRRLSIRICEL